MGRVDFGPRDVIGQMRFKDAVYELRSKRNERADHAHARPVMPSDEARLRSCLTMDTLSKRDEAIIVILRKGGFRAEQAAIVQWRHLVRLWCGYSYGTRTLASNCILEG